ncbi:MAG: histidine--tRNA ligase [Chlamydiota bacterium]|nr:histidine--tRNA ligase [Chlamydiota bacterium]
MKYKIPPGVFDIIPEDERNPWKSSHLWNYVEREIRKIAREFGYHEIRTPLFERTELFQRGVGETSDIVSKEMYTFEDKGKRMISLRPEGTAPAMRAFIENNLANRGAIHKLFYIGPMFRYERSQAGRYRQHHQFGVEAIGVSAPEQDVEVIALIYTLYQRLGLKHLGVCLNTLGDNESRKNFRDALKKYLDDYKSELSEDSLTRLEVNPLRILDSKDPNDKKIIENAPSIHEYLSPTAKEHFDRVQELLTDLKIPFTVSDKLVRGLDYYNHTVFEIVAGELGAQNSMVGGGRYDGLIKTLGGQDLPAIGFGCGIERVIQTMLAQMVTIPTPDHPILFFIPLGEKAKNACFKVLHDLRQKGISAQMDLSGRKLNKVMQYANQIRAEYVAVVGDTELETGEIELKEMHTGEKFKAPLNNLSRILRIESEKETFMKVWSELTEPFQDSREKDFFVKKLGSSIQHTSEASHDLKVAVENIQDLVEQ